MEFKTGVSKHGDASVRWFPWAIRLPPRISWRLLERAANLLKPYSLRQRLRQYAGTAAQRPVELHDYRASAEPCRVRRDAIRDRTVRRSRFGRSGGSPGGLRENPRYHPESRMGNARIQRAPISTGRLETRTLTNAGSFSARNSANSDSASSNSSIGGCSGWPLDRGPCWRR